MTSFNDVGATLVCALCAAAGLVAIVLPVLYAGRRHRRRWYE